MNEEQINTEKLLDTTDCLEAIGVFRGWKNFLFVIVIGCLLLLQISFWLVELGYIRADEVKGEATGAVSGAEQIAEAAKQAASEPNRPAAGQQEQEVAGTRFDVRFRHLAWLIRFLNFVLVLAAVLHCLTMLFSLKVSMLGRLGGINHISRAFFLSLIAVVLLLPWQKLFGGVVAGVMYSPEELLRCCRAVCGKGCSIFCAVLHYLRFTGYWLLVVLFFVFSQVRSGRWTRTILRRLEVI